MPDLAIVPESSAAQDDTLTPESILDHLARELGADPFAASRRANAIRTAGQSLRSAQSKRAAAAAHLAECERALACASERALATLTER